MSVVGFNYYKIFALIASWINICMIIYKWTSPSGKQYIGQSIHSLEEKYNWYKKHARLDTSNRYIFNAIRKYGIENMAFSLVEENINWTRKDLDNKEIYYIKHYNTYWKNGQGYNMTYGGEGIDSESAKLIITEWHKNMSKENKSSRSLNCSIGQKRRYKNSSDSLETKQKKSKSHQGKYIVESPEGHRYTANNGLKQFAEDYSKDLGMSYWQLFNAYRKTYQNEDTTRHRKDSNKWKVYRVDK